MNLQVYHRTHHAYASPVHDSLNESRLQPVDNELQSRQSFRLTVQPAPRISQYLDFYLNCVQVIDVRAPHQELTVEAVSLVTTREPTPLPAQARPAPFPTLAGCTQLPECYDFLQPSTYVDPGPEAARLAHRVAADRTDAWQTALALMGFIHTQFVYVPAVTHVHTPMLEALRLRRGVCQDFAHVMIGLCRALHLPARYVSGYIYNGPTDRLKGAQASHAWVEVFIPGIGWRGLDPTNGQQTNSRYVKAAAGRDYADVSPLRGTYRGTAQRKLTVDVLVTRLDADESGAAVAALAAPAP